MFLRSLDKLSDVGVTHQPMLAFSENSYVTPQQKGTETVLEKESAFWKCTHRSNNISKINC